MTNRPKNALDLKFNPRAPLWLVLFGTHDKLILKRNDTSTIAFVNAEYRRLWFGKTIIGPRGILP